MSGLRDAIRGAMDAWDDEYLAMDESPPAERVEVWVERAVRAYVDSLEDERVRAAVDRRPWFSPNASRMMLRAADAVLFGKES